MRIRSRMKHYISENPTGKWFWPRTRRTFPVNRSDRSEESHVVSSHALCDESGSDVQQGFTSDRKTSP